MISGHGNVETAVRAIKLGAYDFIEKPFKADRLILIAERALETSRLKREVNDLRARGGSADRMVGSSSAILNLRRVIEKLGPANSRVLISGAAGSGKELAARLIHESSMRANGPFVVINAPAMSPREWKRNSLESNPAWKGSLGSVRSKRRMPVRFTWTKLPTCRVRRRPKSSAFWCDQNFQRVGGASRVFVDVRVISSTSRDLAEAITEGRFREDLFHRLSVVPILSSVAS